MSAAENQPGTVDVMSPDQLMVLLVCGILLVLGVFALLALVRLWGARMQTRSGATAGLDPDRLRVQLDAGRLSPEEYAAIRRHLTGGKPKGGAPPAEGAGPRESIDLPERASEDPEKESKDGQG